MGNHCATSMAKMSGWCVSVLAGLHTSALIGADATSPTGTDALRSSRLPHATPVPATTLSVDTVLRITVAGESGSTNVVQRADGLENPTSWRPLTNFVLEAVPAVVLDLAMPIAETHFYRVVSAGSKVRPIPSGLTPIPAGSFQMGDSLNEIFENTSDLPVHSVFVSAFYIDQFEVTWALWDDVKTWSERNDYSFDHPGSGKAANHPVHSVNWFDAAKWCNARSQSEGRIPAYYTDAALTQAYKTGRVEPYVKWDRGYRLPTEAEWEKAARGGASGHRFSWTDTETISESRANYFGGSPFGYDGGGGSIGGRPPQYNPQYAVGDFPYTSPAGAFPANGLGLYDMIGNVYEWCWWVGAYSSESQTDPRGPKLGFHHAFRGGGWNSKANNCRVAYRDHINFVPDFSSNDYGFRTVLAPRAHGRPARAIATVTEGTVSGLLVTDAGSGYELAPGVSLGGGAGSGAAAVAVLEGDEVAKIVVTAAGSGYSSAPTVGIAPPPKPVDPATLAIKSVPRLTLTGVSGSTNGIEWAEALENPAVWHSLTNVILAAGSVVVVDASVPTGQRRIYRVASTDAVGSIPSGMALIPGGTFQMGNTIYMDGDYPGNQEQPLHSVLVSSFCLDKHEVTKALWAEVKGWSGGNGYTFDGQGGGKASNHPIQNVSWFDAVKWCNARSENEGRLPAYYTDAALTQLYKTGRLAPFVNWVSGYRLPTEAEWEKAARGGVSDHRFTWSDSETISHSRANYYAVVFFGPQPIPYEGSPGAGYHPTYAVGVQPYTSPVGSFVANGYGLNDLVGNVREWCWDWYQRYGDGFQKDPTGASFGGERVYRGGDWQSPSPLCRVATRGGFEPSYRDQSTGFRCALPLGLP